MENNDIEIGNIEMIQESVQSLLCRLQMEHNHTKKFSPSIYMAPRTLRHLSPSSFNPRVVSIGPLHREDKDVQAFERQKSSYLINLMTRIDSPQEEILKSCMQKVYTSMEQIKACYLWTKTYGDAEIAQMMVIDACFILEFIYLQSSEIDEESLENVLLRGNITCDLVLLENQIPFFILDQIFQCTILKFDPEASLALLIYETLNMINPFAKLKEIDNIYNNTQHILSLLHEFYKPPPYIRPQPFGSTIPCVIDLERAGVNIKPNKYQTWKMEMQVKLSRFAFVASWCKPTLLIPLLIVHDFTELVLRNLIAYEHSCQTSNYITSYVAAMDMLVDTKEDVAKLVDSKVLINIMGSNEEAANTINNIAKEVGLTYFFYEEECQILNEYCNSYWPKNIAWLRSTYFNNPWNIIALLAGIILFVLTVVQTFFTIKPVGSNK